LVYLLNFKNNFLINENLTKEKNFTQKFEILNNKENKNIDNSNYELSMIEANGEKSSLESFILSRKILEKDFTIGHCKNEIDVNNDNLENKFENGSLKKKYKNRFLNNPSVRICNKVTDRNPNNYFNFINENKNSEILQTIKKTEKVFSRRIQN